MKHLINLKKLLVLSICVALLTIAQAQNTVKLADETQVSYNLNDSKKLTGAYAVTRVNDKKVFLRGSYKDGARVGNWYAFNADGNVFLRYNYDQKKLVYLDTTSISRLKVEVLAKDQPIKDKAIIPVPIASIDEYVSLLGTEAKRQLLAENKNAEGTLDVDLVARVDPNGRASYEAKYSAQGISVTKRLIISEKYFDLDWIPANFEDKNYASLFTVRARINFSEKDPTQRRFIWAY